MTARDVVDISSESVAASDVGVRTGPLDPSTGSTGRTRSDPGVNGEVKGQHVTDLSPTPQTEQPQRRPPT